MSYQDYLDAIQPFRDELEALSKRKQEVINKIDSVKLSDFGAYQIGQIFKNYNDNRYVITDVLSNALVLSNFRYELRRLKKDGNIAKTPRAEYVSHKSLETYYKLEEARETS